MAKFEMDTEFIRKLAKLLEETNLGEIEMAEGDRRITANPHANGGELRKPLLLPDFRDYAVTVAQPGRSEVSSCYVLGQFLRDVMRENMTGFRVFGPDETASNQLQAVYEATKKTWLAESRPEDADGGELATDGRVMVCGFSAP